jgi:hypothetical protein
VRVGEQLVEADVDEARVAVARLAIGERALEDLEHEVDVVGVAAAQAVEPGMLDRAQRLGEDRPLAPRPAGQHLPVAPACAHGRLAPAVKLGEVLAREQAAVVGMERGDAGGDVAAVERVARGAQARLAPARQRRALLVGEVLQRGGEVALDEALADHRRAPPGQEDRRARRPARVRPAVRLELLGQ